MNYLEAIKIGFITFPFLAFIITIPFILWQYHKYGSVNKFRVLIIYSFILYIICVYFLAILPLPDRDSINMNSKVCQLIPFNFILDILNKVNFNSGFNIFLEGSIYTVLFNILMFMPFGMYLRYYFKYDLKETILFSFMFSLFLEITQLTGLYFIYPHPYRLFDVDDLIINTLGGIFGYLLMGMFIRYLPSREKIDLDSYEEGKKVSGLRRITRFCLDGFIFFIFTGIVGLMFDFKYFYVLLIIYYVIIPFLFKGQTLGSRFLNMKLEYSNKGLFRLFLRLVLIVLYYIIVPFGIGYIFMYCARNFDLSNILVFVVGAIYVLLLGVFYLLNVTYIFKRKILFYDNLCKVKYVSTIGDE